MTGAAERSVVEPLQPMPESGPMFECHRRVRTGDVDMDERLRLDGVARFLQDIAFDHIAQMPGDVNPVWVVRRSVIDVLRPIPWHSEVHLQRWCSAMSTRWATMRVRLTSEGDADDPGGLIETEAFWISINPETGAPMRISDALEADLLARTTEHRLRWRPMLTGTAPALADGAEERDFALRAADIDPMRHLNNAVYLHAVEDLLAQDPALRAAPHRVIVEYLRPVEPGAALRVRTAASGGGVGLWFLVGDVEHARARVRPLG
ncbi:acyl-[acyl-carrier-protein] thioesterase [Tomitella gaofuii]|uniref:acyl-[acyl-carrier-protein] thioesterase n=1 Tax=Tomitella gaofuii TaxID=2760083 RepID=UPI0015FC9AD2|nr:acyl-ACP thioesterase domain-containing protein [Tomitella gaofuii]